MKNDEARTGQQMDIATVKNERIYTMIFYFSGTGNTRWAAEKIAAETGDRLLSIADELRGDCTYQLQADERLGFCFPVHGWQPPHIVRQFIRRLHLSTAASGASETYTFVVCTCGDSIGRTVELLQDELTAKGLTIDSAFSLVMPESYVCLPFMYTDTPAREQEKIAKASADLARYCQMIAGRERGHILTTRGLAPWTMSHVVGAYFNSRMISDRKFRVAADACLHCGRCQQVCPTGDLYLTAGEDGSPALPHWRHDGSCTCCLACYHHCPVHAIDYGRYTPRRGQYYFGHRDKRGQDAGGATEKRSDL